jgi:CheY-like chemotaxis protein/predicted DNA-binding transcriptional regulator AlpA
MAEKEFLNSWKELAQYVGRSERTIQRWERDLGFPVHRPAGRPRGSVIAVRAEVQRWIERTPQSHPATNDSLTLLCIDDDRTSHAGRKTFLESQGYRVLVGAGSKNGVDLFEQNWIDLVLLSLTTGELEAEVILRMLNRRNPKTPILLVLSETESPPPGTRPLFRRVVRDSDNDAVLLCVIEDCLRIPHKLATPSSSPSGFPEKGRSTLIQDNRVP